MKKLLAIFIAGFVIVMSQVSGKSPGMMMGAFLFAHSLESIHPQLTALMPFALILKTTSPR
jgi:hypothetical protein